MDDGNALKRPCIVAVIGDGTGDVTRASMLDVGPLPGDSSRSSREESLLSGVEWCWD